jgi:hypothetical protein
LNGFVGLLAPAGEVAAHAAVMTNVIVTMNLIMNTRTPSGQWI